MKHFWVRMSLVVAVPLLMAFGTACTETCEPLVPALRGASHTGVQTQSVSTKRGTPTPIAPAYDLQPQGRTSVMKSEEAPDTVKWRLRDDVTKGHKVHFQFYRLKLKTAHVIDGGRTFKQIPDQLLQPKKCYCVPIVPILNTADSPKSGDVYLLMGTYREGDEKGAGVHIFTYKKP